MAQIKQAAIDYELKRWMRPDAYRFIGPDWRRHVKAGSALYSVFELYERKYSPDQPRVPAGNRDGGQWTGEGGGAASTPEAERTGGLGDQQVLSDANSRTYYTPNMRLAQLAGGAVTTIEVRSVYDKADGALLAPKGINETASVLKLEYHFDDNSRYLGGVTVVNEDRTAVGRMINVINDTPVHVGFEAQIQTADDRLQSHLR